MNRITTLFGAATLAATSSVAHATVVAQFDSFAHSNDVATLSTDSSAQTDWTTSSLTDLATGTGALSGSNQAGSNRKINTFGATPTIQFSSNRESDAQTPLAAGGNNESTWTTFNITATGGAVLNFDGQLATAETFAEGTGLGGSVSADWTLYYSLDSGTSWTALGTETGASIGGNGGESSAVAVSWDLSPVGTAVSAVDFILDPESTGSTNGNVSQRGVAVGNLAVNATVIPEPGFALLSALGIFGLLRRRTSMRRS